jgi:hypothetical protein
MEEVARVAWEDESPLAEVAPPAPQRSGAGSSALLEVAQRRWADVRKVCKSRSPSVSGLLSSARPVAQEPGAPPTIVLQVDFQFHLEQLRDPTRRQTVEWALEQIVEEPVLVRFTLASDAATSPPPSGAPSRRESSSGAPPDANGNGAHGAYGSSATHGARSSRHTNGKRGSEPPLMNLVRESPGSNSLEDEARADPVVQALLRSGANLLDVRTLEDDSANGS